MTSPEANFGPSPAEANRPTPAEIAQTTEIVRQRQQELDQAYQLFSRIAEACQHYQARLQAESPGTTEHSQASNSWQQAMKLLDQAGQPLGVASEQFQQAVSQSRQIIRQRLEGS